jgi:hypothetical protein
MILLATLIHLPNLIDSATFSLPFWQTHHLEDPQRSHLFSVLWGLIGLASSLLQSEEESLTTKRRTLKVLQLTGYAEFKMKNDIDQVMIGRLCQQNHRQTSGSGGKILSMQLIKPLLLLVILTKTVLLSLSLLFQCIDHRYRPFPTSLNSSRPVIKLRLSSRHSRLHHMARML